MKKIKYQLLGPIVLSMLLLFSCNKYLDIQPKGVQLLKTVKDYNDWLNNDAIETVPRNLNLLADNEDNIQVVTPPTSVDDRIYTWQEQFLVNPIGNPGFWSPFYQAIYYYNTVLKGINAATGGTVEQKKSLKAEALLGRAFNYLYLVNLYGKVYNSQTAGQDLAVPFVTSNDLSSPIPPRSTVQDIYDSIISDINAAIPNLPKNNSENRFRGSVAAGYSVLARTYLYMGEYTKAAQNAQLALDNGPDSVINYNSIPSGTSPDFKLITR
ncbi:MAG: RagB/SusD family nutrient uptake outer membrane protein, partial [Tannerellaceae bacterium]|nr:RagB/SusD family nutrient uptake outer membrane protein [Tannerellaceae bacterium]